MTTVCSNWADLKHTALVRTRVRAGRARSSNQPAFTDGTKLPFPYNLKEPGRKQTPLIVQRDHSPCVLQYFEFGGSLCYDWLCKRENIYCSDLISFLSNIVSVDYQKRELEGSLPFSQVLPPRVHVVISQRLIIDVAYIVYYKLNSRKRKCSAFKCMKLPSS